MSKDAKLLRGQIRQIVKEMWPELVASELYQELSRKNKEQLDLIHKMVRETLEKIDERQKTVQSMVMRELAASNNPTPKPETPQD